ncbi:uncharacterized protein LOC141856514 isoform X1 [Brevipalpus obovatus]|uniref:uncharacterized protein LOC141856514 isoform X1 n=1 Tax=Brevipalpus obovatus TaxID=246614 RepID=UPI003D9F06F3
MYSLILFSSFFLVNSFISVSGSSSSHSCHLRELDLCAATLLVFTQNPSEVTGNDAELDRQCGFIKEADACRRNYTRRCTTPLQRELIDFISQGGEKVADEFCTPGSNLREEYKKHARCLGEARGESQFCAKDLQRALEVIPETTWDVRVPTACCAYNRFDECSSSIIRRKCGPKALALSRRVIRLAASRLPEILCQGNSPNSQKCLDVLPAAGEQPLGARSNSVLSRIFATYTGQRKK